MRDQIDCAEARRLADGADSLPHIADGELPGFPVDVVAQESAARPAGRPRQNDANEIPPEQSADVPRRIGRIAERVVIAMNEDDDFLSFGLRQPATNFALKRGNGLFVRGHDIRRTAIAARSELCLHKEPRENGQFP